MATTSSNVLALASAEVQMILRHPEILLTSTMRTMDELAELKLLLARQENCAESFIFTCRIMSLDTIPDTDSTSFFI